MKTQGRRIAKRGEQRRARREERLRQQALLDNLGSTEWWEEELEATPTEHIVKTLAKLNIRTDEARFRELALAHGSVDGVAAAWLVQATAPGNWQDYPWLAARALWPRWTPDLFSIDVFIHQYLDADVFAEDDPETPEDAQRRWRVAQAMIDLVAPRGAEARPDLLEEMTKHSAIDIGFWLGCLPFNLARFGMLDEAVEICTRMAPVYEPENFLTDGAEILAQAGRWEEALRRVEENLARFPDDVWVRIKSGDVYEKVGNLSMAEATYRQALAMTDEASPSHEREAAVERLERLLQTAGRGLEADALVKAEESRDAKLEEVFAADYEEFLAADDQELNYGAAGPAAPVRSPRAVRPEGPKVGRNEPCPCGSGKKFKRCCGR